MKKLLFLSLFLTACGGDAPDFCSAGVCTYNVHGYEHITPEFVEETVEATEQALRWRGLDLDLPVDLEKAGTMAIFIDEHPKLAGNYIGRCVGNKLYVKTGTTNTCLRDSRVLGHEILHLVAREVMKVDSDENADHTTPYLFVQSGPGSVEEFMISLVAENCEK